MTMLSPLHSIPGTFFRSVPGAAGHGEIAPGQERGRRQYRFCSGRMESAWGRTESPMPFPERIGFAVWDIPRSLTALPPRLSPAARWGVISQPRAKRSGARGSVQDDEKPRRMAGRDGFAPRQTSRRRRLFEAPLLFWGPTPDSAAPRKRGTASSGAGLSRPAMRRGSGGTSMAPNGEASSKQPGKTEQPECLYLSERCRRDGTWTNRRG